MTGTGLPHSEIPGSKVVCTSPRLFAAYHVFHRLHVPRHPPYALSSFTKVSFLKMTWLLESLIKMIQFFQFPNFQKAKKFVELTGIEPMTSCVQSRRSPN